MPTISTAGSGADRQRHLDIPPESRRRSTFANPTPAFSKSLSRLCQPNYSSTFVHQHPSPSLCMRERRTTFCNDYYDSELPRHYQWRYRRSNTLRFASRARRRNKRFLHPRWLAVFGWTGEIGHDLRLRLRLRLLSRLLLLGLSLDTLNIHGLGCVGVGKHIGVSSRVGLIIKVGGLFLRYWRPTSLCSGAGADTAFSALTTTPDIAMSRPVCLTVFLYYLVAFIN